MKPFYVINKGNIFPISIMSAVLLFVIFIISISGCARKPLTAVYSVLDDEVVLSNDIGAINADEKAETVSEASSSNVPDKTDPTENLVKKQVEHPSLENKIICIDPGHQSIANYGREPIAPGSSLMKEKMTFGTSGTATKVPEYQLNLEVSLKLKEKLEASNSKVIMARETNEVDISNVERALIANKNNPDIIVRIHADGIENQDVKGTSVLYPGKEYIHDIKMLESSKKAAGIILEAIINNTHSQSRGVIERNDMTGFNWSDRPVILIEMGFMTNPSEDRLMNTQEYQDKIVEGLLQGLSKYFETNQ